MPVKVKICGLTRVEDVRCAVELGADFIGLNFHPRSPRRIDASKAEELLHAVSGSVQVVGVFADASRDAILRMMTQLVERSNVANPIVQLHGKLRAEWVSDLTPYLVIPAIRWQGDSSRSELDGFFDQCVAKGTLPAALLIDSYRPGTDGGTGQAWDWRQAADLHLPVPFILAGGLTADNVTRAIDQLHPAGVDVASGVESQPGIKDRDKMARFVAAVRSLP